MKKILILLIIILSINYVYAEEKEISHIEYKWYKEERIDTKYYPKKDNLPGYYEDTNIVKYSEQTQWAKSYCAYKEDYYLIESLTAIKYKRPINVRYILLNTSLGTEGVDNYKTIKIFDNNHELNYKVLINDRSVTKIELDKEYNPIYLHFYIETDLRYFIYLFNNYDQTKLAISYSVIPYYHGYTLYPTKEWIGNTSIFIDEGTTGKAPDSPLVKDITEETICRVQEINTLRYKLQRKYYDDNYHIYIEGYLPDINESVIYYKEKEEQTEPPKIETKIETQTETKIKTIKEKIYEYLTPEKQTIYETNTIYKDKYKYKNIYKKIIPKKIYIIIIILIMIILLETMYIMSKNER